MLENERGKPGHVLRLDGIAFALQAAARGTRREKHGFPVWVASVSTTTGIRFPSGNCMASFIMNRKSSIRQ